MTGILQIVAGVVIFAALHGMAGELDWSFAFGYGEVVKPIATIGIPLLFLVFGVKNLFGR